MTCAALVFVQCLASACLINGEDATPLRFHVLRGNRDVRADGSKRADCGGDKTGPKDQLELHPNLARDLRPPHTDPVTTLPKGSRSLRSAWSAAAHDHD